MPDITAGYTYTDTTGSNYTVNHSNLNSLVSGSSINTGAIISSKLAAGAVTNDKVSSSAGIAFSKLASLTDTYLVIGNSSDTMVGVALSGDATINSSGVIAIGSDKITTAKILDANVTTAKIAANAVDGTKLAMGSDAKGDVIYYDGTDYVRLGPGADGEFLKTQGAGEIPQWATPVDMSVPLLVVFTSSGSNNWTVPSGVTRIRVVLIGGGGSSSAYATLVQGVGAGGAGGYVEKTLAVTPDDTIQFDVGAGGAASAWNNDGFDGDDSTFTYGGATYTAGGGGKGGGSGASTAVAGVGGTATGGDLNVAAQGYDAYGQGGGWVHPGEDGAAGVYFGAGGICGDDNDFGGSGADGLIRVEY